MAGRASCDQEVRSGERRQPSVDTAWVHIVGNEDWRFACESQNFLHKIRLMVRQYLNMLTLQFLKYCGLFFLQDANFNYETTKHVMISLIQA